MEDIMEKLIDIVDNVLNGDISCINTNELGEAIDMIKDMSEAMYHCKVVQYMDEKYCENKVIPDEIKERMYYNQVHDE